MDMKNIKVKLGISEVGIKPNINVIKRIFSKYYYIDLIAVLTTINLNSNIFEDENEYLLRGSFISSHLNKKLTDTEHRMKSRGLVFTRQITLLLIDYAILYGQRVKEKSVGIIPTDVGIVYLVMNSFVAKVENYVINKKEDQDISIYADFAIKSISFNSKPQMRYAISRGYLIYKSLRSEVKPEYQDVHINDLIFEKRQFGFTDLYEMMIVLYSHYGSFKKENIWNGMVINIHKIFENVVGDVERINKILMSMSLDLETYKPNIPNEKNYKEWYSYMYKFYNYRLNPLLKFNDVLFCVDLHFVINSFWDAPYNIVVTDHRSNKKKLEHFFHYLGESFEKYIHKISEYAFKEKFSQVVLQNGKPLNDGVITLNESWKVIFEVKAGRLTSQATAGTEPFEDISDFNKLIRDGMEQLNNRITEYRQEGFSGRITPILITSGYVPLNEIIWRRLLPHLEDLEIFQNKISDWPIFLDVEAWEAICASNLKYNDLDKLLNSKLKDLKNWFMSPHDFLYDHHFSKKEPPLDVLLSLHQDIWNNAIHNLFQRKAKFETICPHWTEAFGKLDL